MSRSGKDSSVYSDGHRIPCRRIPKIATSGHYVNEVFQFFNISHSCACLQQKVFRNLLFRIPIFRGQFTYLQQKVFRNLLFRIPIFRGQFTYLLRSNVSK